jgi:hypothetical protein
MPEISDSDFELLKLSKAALGGKTRLKALRVLKEASPETVLPELDTDDRISAALSPIQEENKKLREDLAQRDAVSGLERKRDALRSKGVDVAAVEKLMLEKGITSHESAAEFLALNSRVAAPATPGHIFDRSVTVPKDDRLKANPALFAREEAAKVMAEFAAAK